MKKHAAIPDFQRPGCVVIHFLLFLAISGITCNSIEHKTATLTYGNVTVRQIDKTEAVQKHNSAVREKDWFIETPTTTLVVAGTYHERSGGHPAGSIVGLYYHNQFSDNLSAFSVYVEETRKKTSWNVLSVEPKIISNHAGLSITQVSFDNRLLLRTFIQYSQKTESFKIWSRLKNIDRSITNQLSLGSSVNWDGGFVFAPQLGFVEDSITGNVPWTAMKGRKYSTGIALHNGTYRAQYLFDPHGPYENTLIAHTTLLLPNGHTDMEQHIFIEKGGLESIAKRAWKISGIRTGRIDGKVFPMQSWGEIAVQSNPASPVLFCNVQKDGSFAASVPLGEYDVELITPGGKITNHAVISANRPNVTLSFSTVKPGIVHFLVSDETLLPIPTRLIVRGMPPTEDPMLGPRHKASGAENVIYSAVGSGTIELPEGTYRILATHGPEFSIDEKEVVSQAGRHVSINQVLKEEIDRAGWLSADFHLHAEPSHDSDVSLTDRVISLLAENVDIAVATDHNAVTDYVGAVHAMNSEHELHTGIGVEVTTWNPKWGHFNVWPWSKNAVAPQWTNQTPSKLFAFVREQQPDAVIQVNHPRMDYYDIGYFTLAGLNLNENRFDDTDASFDFDAVELFNGMDLKHPEIVEKNISEWLMLLKSGRRFAATGNSDSHFLVGHFAGYPRNYLHMQTTNSEGYTIEDIADAVKAGRSFVSNGPFIRATLADATFGDEITVKPNRKIDLLIHIQSASWLPLDYVSVIVNGDEIIRSRIETPIENEKVTFTFPLTFTEDSYVLVKTGGDFLMDNILPDVNATPLAFSNPIWVRVRKPSKKALHTQRTDDSDLPFVDSENADTTPLTDMDTENGRSNTMQ